MSTRQERQDWQDFREQNGGTLTAFKTKWRAMFNREPTETEILSYVTKRKELLAPLGHIAKRVRRDEYPVVTYADITVERIISMGHRLPSYVGICSSMHGHNVRIRVTLSTKQFTDFKKIDADLKKLTDPLDHAMVLYEKDPFVVHLRNLPQRMVLLTHEPSTEVIAQLIFNEIRALGYCAIEVKVYETDKYAASVTSTNADVKRVPL